MQISKEMIAMVEIESVYTGSLRCVSTHEPSGATLNTDAPKDNMGKGESFSPTDLVATALGTCMLTTMGIVAQRMNISLRGTSVKVQKEMITTGPRRIAKLSVEMHIPTPLTSEQREKLRNAAMSCPVHKSLHPDVEIPVSFHFESKL
jgi:putative redox protein